MNECDFLYVGSSFAVTLPNRSLYCDKNDLELQKMHSCDTATII